MLLPPAAGAVADAIEINRPLLEESAPYQTGAEYDIWISEVYPAAGQGRQDAAHEWLELSNRSDQPISLDGWTLADNHSSDALDGIIVPAGDSVVLAATHEGVPGADAAVTDGRIGNGLANAGDRLVLMDAEGRLVDALSWGSDRAHGAIDAPTPEQSANRSIPGGALFLATPNPGIVAVPGSGETLPRSDSVIDGASLVTEPSLIEFAPASVAGSVHDPVSSPRTLRITELMPAPNSGEPEWIEIENYGDTRVSLNGWTLADGQSSSQLRGELRPGERMIVSNGPLSGQASDVGIVVLVDKIGNGLNNEGETISLLDPNGMLVDTVTYGSDATPAPARGLSVALEPARWVVTSSASPGDSEVSPLLADALTQTPEPAPGATSNSGVPVIEAANLDSSQLNPWLIVSAGLSGVILVLLLLRWRPPTGTAADAPTPDAVSFSEPSPVATDEQPSEDSESSP